MKVDFINSDFLLETPLARTLYHEYVEGLPIADYHNHLVPAELASDRRFSDIGQLWVASDPYKHRAMRLHGENEAVIFGHASTREKFDAWARTLPHTLGNPLFHWSAMEMKNVFGLDEMPDPSCADKVWDACNERLKEDSFSTMGILRGFGVKVLSTSDDLLDDVTVHSSVRGDIKVTPSLRADSVLGFAPAWLERLGSPKTLEEYLAAVDARLDVFSENGCRVADHALDDGWRFVLTDFETAAKLYAAAEFADVRLKSFVLGHLACEYSRRGWAMLLHIGAQR
ncbi:MAG: glucuronate isomerase, partial [Bacteroidales bacterium]|nr:glucuronate isomerase [Bacteroidales bacterium]